MTPDQKAEALRLADALRMQTRTMRLAGQFDAVVETMEASDVLLRTLAAEPPPCIGNDPLCPCQDGLACHYKDVGNTKAFPIPPLETEPHESPSPTFDAWWDSDKCESADNPFRRDSAAYWAWAGWQAATFAERERLKAQSVAHHREVTP